MADSDRKKIKDQEKGVIATAAGIVAPFAAIEQCHEETFTWEIAADATVVEVGMVCEKPFKVKSMKFTGNAALAANASNYITQLAQKRDGAGGAAVTVGTIDTNTAGGNQSIAAFVGLAGVLSATAANLIFAAGNILSVKSTETGTPATPIGKVQITVEYI